MNLRTVGEKVPDKYITTRIMYSYQWLSRALDHLLDIRAIACGLLCRSAEIAANQAAQPPTTLMNSYALVVCGENRSLKTAPACFAQLPNRLVCTWVTCVRVGRCSCGGVLVEVCALWFV